MKQSDILTKTVETDFRLHALEEYPRECCGFVTKDLQYVRMVNSSQEPELSSYVKARDRLEFMQKHGEPIAFLHSHPDGPDCPSRIDMEFQVSNAIPFGITATNGQMTSKPFLWGDQLERAPLIGRPYRYGVHDCYSLARDYYFEKGIILPVFPRDWEWWKTGGNMFVDHFAEAKFHRIDRCDLMEGDSILFSVSNTAVPNHVGVYVGDGQMLHHLTSISSPQWDPRKLSKRDPVDRWMKYSTHCLRYSE